MTFARRVFLIAGVYGLLVLLPQYFLESRTGRDFPPPITHSEYYYGFVGIAVAWQVVFLVIARDPTRYRPLMIPAILEKASFAIPAAVLFVLGRLSLQMLAAGMLDVVLGVFFALAYVRTAPSPLSGKEESTQREQPNMSRAPRLKRWVATVVLVLLPAWVSAQSTTSAWPSLKTTGLQTVYVVDETGAETSGKLLSLTPESLTLLVGDTERLFPAARVRRIDKRGDSLKNGAIIGAIAGVALGLAVGGLADCSNSGSGGSCAGFRTEAVLLSVGIYTAIGTAIDAVLVGRTTLYMAPSATSSAALQRSAVGLSRRGYRAVVLTFGW